MDQDAARPHPIPLTHAAMGPGLRLRRNRDDTFGLKLQALRRRISFLIAVHENSLPNFLR